MLGPGLAAHHIELRACLATRTDASAVSAVSAVSAMSGRSAWRRRGTRPSARHPKPACNELGRPALRTTGPTNQVINSSTQKDPTSLADPTILYRHLKAEHFGGVTAAVEPHQILRVRARAIFC